MPSRRLLHIGGAAAFLPRRAPAQADSTLAGHLNTLMAQHHVPAASVALIRDGAIVEHIAIGADPQTLFQAASISKVVTGVVILQLVDRREIDLDRPVNEALRSWKLSEPDAESVTARQLLSHRAGMNVPGFPGYAAGAHLPTLRQILDGAPPANTDPVRVDWKPGRASAIPAAARWCSSNSSRTSRAERSRRFPAISCWSRPA